MNTHCRQMKQENQFTIGNWAIGLRALPHVMAEFNSENHSALKASMALKV